MASSMTFSSALACNYGVGGLKKLSSKPCSMPCLASSTSSSSSSSSRVTRVPMIIKASQEAQNSTEERVDKAKRASLVGLVAALVATPFSTPAIAETTQNFLENTSCVVKYGPFGDQTGQEWSVQLEPSETITELNVKASAIADSIEFITSTPTICGEDIDKAKFGGVGGDLKKITFKAGEYVTKISGANATYKDGSGGVRGVARLKIHTNLNPNGYGPFGSTSATTDYKDFTSLIPSTGKVVGFFGTRLASLEP